MSILIFIVDLAVLIFVHELGHFLVAKWSGIRVDEFSVGFPPRIAKWRPKGSETQYSIGAIPIGGYVKIFGETPDEESMSGPDSHRSLVNKSRLVQVGTLVAGVSFNLIFAWILISIGFMVGLPASENFETSGTVENARLSISGVLPGSPADEAGLESSDAVVAFVGGTEELDGTTATVEEAQAFIREHEKFSLTYDRAGTVATVELIPEMGVVGDAPAIGVGLDRIGLLQLPVHTSLWEGAKLTAKLTGRVAVGLGLFVRDAFIGNADFRQVTGPVGLVGLVGSASTLGFVYLMSFAAFISINLAVINIIPVPALDGGRILFVIIEGIRGSAIKPKIANLVNTVGFALLILLMVVVTYNDILNLVR